MHRVHHFPVSGGGCQQKSPLKNIFTVAASSSSFSPHPPLSLSLFVRLICSWENVTQSLRKEATAIEDGGGGGESPLGERGDSKPRSDFWRVVSKENLWSLHILSAAFLNIMFWRAIACCAHVIENDLYIFTSPWLKIKHVFLQRS